MKQNTKFIWDFYQRNEEMTQDEIIEMLKESDLDFLLGDNWMLHHELETFAKLVAAKEREACANICDEYSATGKIEEFDRGWLACAKNIATAIRARGEQA